MPRSFTSREHIAGSLRAEDVGIAGWFDAVRHATAADVVAGSVGNSTFRAFHHMPRRPSVVFNEWATGWLASGVARQVSDLRSQAEYDAWSSAAGEQLARYWMVAMGPERSLPYGPGRKMVDLVMKEYARSAELDDDTRRRLIDWLHVPLDSSTLEVVRACSTEDERARLPGRIPAGARMGFVRGQLMYDAAQGVLRSIAAEAEVPPIYLDVLIWNVPAPAE